jgi:hypothetical protein
MKNRIKEIAVTDLATRLDEARIAANDIEEAAPQSGVYGDISDALRKTLAVLLDGDHVRAEAVYQAILDGNTVAQALAVEARERAAMAAVAEEPVETAGGRIRKALDALSRHGVTEKQVQTKSELSDERWAHFTDTEKAGLPGIRTVELAMLADALMLDATYLLNGERTYSVKYSPCTLKAMIADRYPAGN